MDPPALTGQAVGPGGGFASKKPTTKIDLANRTIDRSDRHNGSCWWRVPGAWSVGRGVERSSGRAVERSAVGPLAVLAIGFYVAKIANSPLMIGNLGYCFLVAKIANKWRENRQREVWRGDVASLIGAKTLAILARLSCENNRC